MMKNITDSMQVPIMIIVMIALSLVNCNQPVQDNYIYQTDPPQTFTEEIMNDFTVKKVDEYSGYYEAPGGQVFGILPDIKVAADMDKVLPMIRLDGADEDIETIFDSFFVKDGVMYFSVSHFFGPVDPENPEDKGELITKYCQQVDGVVFDTAKKEDFPEMPAVAHGVFDDGEVSLIVGDYKGDAISVLHRKSDPEGYSENLMMIDGLIRIDGGYMIHIVEGRGSERLPGLNYWPDGEGRMDFMNKDAGRFWGM